MYEQKTLFNRFVEATIEIYINYLSCILVECDMPPSGTSLDKRLTEPLWQTSIIELVEPGQPERCPGDGGIASSLKEMID